MAYKGKFKPTNPSKYKGDPTNIIYRSRWELVFMNYCDSHKDITKWASEEFFIPYRSLIDGKLHRYFPDFYVEKINKDGRKEIVVIEIKPRSQTIEPKPSKQITKRYLYEVQEYGRNISKWKAAEKFCLERGWRFMIMTEKELGIKF